MNNEKPTYKFPALTGIRAIAAYLVYLHHTNPFSAARYGTFIHSFVNQFHIGVTIFFVLSGLLITHRYYDAGATKEPWLKKYLQNRIARVYPMYFILTSLTLIVFFSQNKQGATPLFVYLMNISFLKGFFDDLKFTLISQGWSLTVEECFYISAPLLFLFFKKSKWHIGLATVAFLSLGCLLVYTFHSANFFGFFKSYKFLFTYTFLGRCIEFFWGAGIVIFFRSQIANQKEGFISTLLGAILITGFVILMSILDMDPSGIHKSAIIAINNFLLPGAVAIFFYGLLREETFVKAMLSSNWLLTLGKASYTFYLIHAGIIYSMLNRHFPNGYILTFLIINFLALILWRSVEEPLNKCIRGL